MKLWLAPALDYVATWLDFQRSHHEQPGCAVAIADGDEAAAAKALDALIDHNESFTRSTVNTDY